MTTGIAMKELAVLMDLFPLLPESASVFDEWRQLVARYAVSGKNTHDARLVAAMLTNGMGQILTFNVQDFVRFKEIEALHPAAVRP